MSLQCQTTLNYSSMTAGQTPPPMATLQVYNPNASAVVVTGFAMRRQAGGAQGIPYEIPAIGPGINTSVPALSSITFGPFPITAFTAANANSFQAVNQSGNLNPINPQLAMPPQARIFIGFTVYGSDGSINLSGLAGLLVSYATPPPNGFQGGFLNFAGPNNAVTGVAAGIL